MGGNRRGVGLGKRLPRWVKIPQNHTKNIPKWEIFPKKYMFLGVKWETTIKYKRREK